ncbi:dGTP triphosphohydrolase [Aquisalibacillus elongatus]|uniref:dGTP triphosphohydrolase n=1 Tax=Aquisalibacillus elongatus TaxID=485577 RepID=UPI001FE33B29|nr:dNTP triphosphohydrolase [Aquisalibacillus elongatus]
MNETRPKYKNRLPYNNHEVDVNQDLYDHRNEFEKDYDRIMSSSSLRRLQDKAQVFPLQANDFIRTRLTHSIEVSAIARSFGVWLERRLIEKNKELGKEHYGKLPAMLATAGLVHDIGNPPFGHYGEDIIKNWFKSYFKKNKNLNLTAEQENDFKNFDGNAQGIRVLTSLQFLNDRFGINFTYGTLSVLLKYPWSSSECIEKDKEKFGFFQKDKLIGKEIISQTTGLESTRNPLTYFLEAADDIAYYGSDVEDGVKKEIIPWEHVFETKIKAKNSNIYKAYKEDIDKLIEKHDRAKANKFPDYLLTSVQNFKVWAQGQMIREVKEVFLNNYIDIMNGKFGERELLKETKNAHLLYELLNSLLKDYCFGDKEVISLELVGDSVLSDLLNTFIDECVLYEDFKEKPRYKTGKLYRLISENFIYVHLLNEDPKGKNRTFEELTTYERLLLITDFISGMTDSYALDLHQKLKGVKMP